MAVPPLDILLYAHDGRGLGHVSRAVAVGLAVRRRFPTLKVCLVTGCRQTQELIGAGRLDWLKLPAYDTEVVAGTSRGIDGPSGFSDEQLGLLRGEQIRWLVHHYRPRLVLADHTPQGKHRELVPALEDRAAARPVWVLGMRSVVGAVAQTGSPLAVELFAAHYTGLLWYGDSRVAAAGQRAALAARFDSEPVECGYVSRLTEQARLAGGRVRKRDGWTVSVPWAGPATASFLAPLAAAVRELGPGTGPFRFFAGGAAFDLLRTHLDGLEFCSLHPFGASYLEALLGSRQAVVYGGYNSLIDVLAADIPALVAVRDMQDGEQRDHVEALIAAAPGRLAAVDETGTSAAQLKRSLVELAQTPPAAAPLELNLDGAARAASELAERLGPEEP